MTYPSDPHDGGQGENPGQSNGQQPYGQPDNGAPQYGAPQYGAPQYGAPQYGAPQYGAPPYGSPYGAAGPEPDNNLVWAILSTILCCLPLGIVSIVKSTSVSRLWALGDYAGAQQAADDAKKWAMWSAIATVAIYAAILIFYVLFFVIVVSMSGSSS